MNRRKIITLSSAAVGGALVSLPQVQAARAERSKPQSGDILVYAFGEKKGVAITPEMILDERIFAFPKSAEGIVRDGSLHNQVSLLKVDALAMSDKTRQYAAGSIIAVSAACTHTGCEVSGWKRESHQLVCPCHGSTFDVLDAARVLLGPATKPLAYLPIETTDGAIRVAGKFTRRVGPAPQF